jgi:hypothetical protein
LTHALGWPAARDRDFITVGHEIVTEGIKLTMCQNGIKGDR